MDCNNTTHDGMIWPFVRSPYNYNMDEATKQTALKCTDPTRTQQQFKDECDINVILERFGVTGHLPTTTLQPIQGDFTNIEGDFHAAVEAISAAERNFMTLPSKVRERFNNKAEQFVDFCVNPDNIEAVREMNLAPRPPAPKMAELVKENGNAAS